MSYERFMVYSGIGDNAMPYAADSIPERARSLPERELLDSLYAFLSRQGSTPAVSDTIVIFGGSGETVKAYSFTEEGFIQIEHFPENYLKYIEMAVKGNYNMIDGIINNLPPANSKSEEGGEKAEQNTATQAQADEARKKPRRRDEVCL